MGRFFSIMILIAGALCAPAIAHAGPTVSSELGALYKDILKDPTDSKANLRYARLAEVQGQLRLALAAYERVILNDPKNVEAQAGFARVRRLLQPPLTQVYVKLGTGVDTNPLNLHSGYETKPTFSADFSLRNERVLLSQRWRTLINATGDYPLDIGELLYGYVGFQTGPLLAATHRVTVYPAVGGGVSTLDKSFFYGEGNASVTFEGRYGGAFQAIRFRGGYRSYGSHFTADEGYFADAVARLTLPRVFGGTGAIQLSPWARWSGIDGVIRNALTGDRAPGRYVEWGAEIGYYFRPVRNLTLGANITGRQRLYLETDVGGERREDNYLAPGFKATRSNVLSCACDVQVDYHYRLNNSNDPNSDYHGHAATVSFASHF